LNGSVRLSKAVLFLWSKIKKRGSQRKKNDVYWNVVMENYGNNFGISETKAGILK